MNRKLEVMIFDMLRKTNVVGYSKFLQPKISDHKVTDIESIRFYVSEKKPMKALNLIDILPKTIEDIPTDVYISGEWKVLPPLPVVKAPIKTTKIRPLKAGISIGNASITAGTHGWYGKKGRKDVGASNAHIVSENCGKEGSVEKRMLQPGSYDGGKEVVGQYLWHKKINSLGDISGCDTSNGIVKSLNFMSKALGRKTRFKTYLELSNNIDFGVWDITTDYNLQFIDYDINEGFFGHGHGFAGSDQTSLICKGNPYMLDEGYTPSLTKFVDVVENNIMYKTGRTTCFNNAPVIDRSGVSQVNYGSFMSIFDDVTITEHLLDGGDSGSFCWVKKDE